MAVTINGDGTVSLNLRAAEAVQADSALNADNADAVDGKNVIPYVSGPYTVNGGATVYVPDADIPRQGAILVSLSGNNGSCLIHVFRSGTYNGVSGVGTSGVFAFGATSDPGSGTWAFWIENNNSGARLVIHSNAGYGRDFRLMSIP